ncbi:hypothetical protein [Kitasatospora sp. NPDC002965]|uniref:hypothetical protein n=1 Tax=Kitasatospora sp. NPDC002965 TaxID=3154775 RepID=UPI0033B09EDB
MTTTALSAPAGATPAAQGPDVESMTTCGGTDCGTEIDPGPATQCGTSTRDGALDGCGRHFCSDHLWLDGVLPPQPQNCVSCLNRRALRTAA